MAHFFSLFFTIIWVLVTVPSTGLNFARKPLTPLAFHTQEALDDVSPLLYFSISVGRGQCADLRSALNYLLKCQRSNSCLCLTMPLMKWTHSQMATLLMVEWFSKWPKKLRLKAFTLSVKGRQKWAGARVTMTELNITAVVRDTLNSNSTSFRTPQRKVRRCCWFCLRLLCM